MEKEINNPQDFKKELAFHDPEQDPENSVDENEIPEEARGQQVLCPECRRLSPILIEFTHTQKGFILSLLCKGCGTFFKVILDSEKEIAQSIIQKSKPSYLG